VAVEVDEPMAIAHVTWLTADEGGRSSGPPLPTGYATICRFEGADFELSLVLKEDRPLSGMSGNYQVDFLSRELAKPFVAVGSRMEILEGPRVVAHAMITQIGPSYHSPDRWTGTR